MNKHKGSNAERELLHMFFKNAWAAARIAGSGSTTEAACDLIAGKAGRMGCAIEVKSSKKSRIYITKAQIEDFIIFSNIFGLRPALAIRFNYQGWLFLDPKYLEDSGKNWVVSLENAKKNGKRFSQFFEN